MNTKTTWKKVFSPKTKTLIISITLVLAFAPFNGAHAFSSAEDTQRRLREHNPVACEWLYKHAKPEQFRSKEELCASIKEIHLLKINLRGERSKTQALILKDQYGAPYFVVLIDEARGGMNYVGSVELLPGEGIKGTIGKVALLSYYEESLILKRQESEGNVKRVYTEIWALQKNALVMIFRGLTEETGPAGGLKCKIKYGAHFPFDIKVKGYTYALTSSGKEKKTGKIKNKYVYQIGRKKYELKK